jgi:lipopolysaccharide/colanic/teichoic acid biosynthesis glycosyltransferase
VPHALEVFLAGLLLLVLSPLLAAVALVILATSGRPVLFGQTRVGMGGAAIRVLKFRTMEVGAERDGSLTIGRDARVTRVGRFLRAHRLDELPQLINVVRGDMGLIGPRPEVPDYAGRGSAYRTAVSRQRPGLTDPASLAFRDEAQLLAQQQDPEDYYRRVLLPAKLALSIEYARCRTFRSDLRLLLRTAGCLPLPAPRRQEQPVSGRAREPSITGGSIPDRGR